MRFPDTPIMAAGHLRAPDVPAQQGYNDFLFRKSQPRNNLYLDEYGIRKILFHFPWAGQKFSLQPKHIHSPDKTLRNQIIVALLPHL